MRFNNDEESNYKHFQNSQMDLLYLMLVEYFWLKTKWF